MSKVYTYSWNSWCERKLSHKLGFQYGSHTGKEIKMSSTLIFSRTKYRSQICNLIFHYFFFFSLTHNMFLLAVLGMVTNFNSYSGLGFFKLLSFCWNQMNRKKRFCYQPVVYIFMKFAEAVYLYIHTFPVFVCFFQLFLDTKQWNLLSIHSCPPDVHHLFM